MDIRKVKKLIELLEESGIAEIEIREGEESVRISRGGPQPPAVQTYYENAPRPAPAPAAGAETASAEAPGHDKVITSPMVGTFYAAASPESGPFVQAGQRVGMGDTLCIIEAMKIMNPIESDIEGTISAVLVENGQPVEFGQPLFAID